jgi:quercetin dioxygenase-like cupin family protein
MKFLETTKDGGAESTVWAHWLIEIKSLFSVALLRFEDGTRDAFHSHAFDCVSWVLSGRLEEEHWVGGTDTHLPSLRPVVTRRDTFHRVRSVGRTWVLTFRGPWAPTWREAVRAGNVYVARTLTNGRKEVKA